MLIRCKECHNEVSDHAPRCPRCGVIAPGYSPERPAVGWHCRQCGFPKAEHFTVPCQACGSGAFAEAFCAGCGLQLSDDPRCSLMPREKQDQVYCWRCFPEPCAICGREGKRSDMLHSGALQSASGRPPPPTGWIHPGCAQTEGLERREATKPAPGSHTGCLLAAVAVLRGAVARISH